MKAGGREGEKERVRERGRGGGEEWEEHLWHDVQPEIYIAKIRAIEQTRKLASLAITRKCYIGPTIVPTVVDQNLDRLCPTPASQGWKQFFFDLAHPLNSHRSEPT